MRDKGKPQVDINKDVVGDTLKALEDLLKDVDRTPKPAPAPAPAEETGEEPAAAEPPAEIPEPAADTPPGGEEEEEDEFGLEWFASPDHRPMGSSAPAEAPVSRPAATQHRGQAPAAGDGEDGGLEIERSAPPAKRPLSRASDHAAKAGGDADDIPVLSEVADLPGKAPAAGQQQIPLATVPADEAVAPMDCEKVADLVLSFLNTTVKSETGERFDADISTRLRETLVVLLSDWDAHRGGRK